MEKGSDGQRDSELKRLTDTEKEAERCKALRSEVGSSFTEILRKKAFMGAAKISQKSLYQTI